VTSTSGLVDRRSSFHFIIGSIESFETKLETLQRDMNLDPRDFVPVNYAERASAVGEWSSLLSISFIPMVRRPFFLDRHGSGASPRFFLHSSSYHEHRSEYLSSPSTHTF
jgi:hypothetical protein